MENLLPPHQSAEAEHSNSSYRMSKHFKQLLSKRVDLIGSQSRQTAQKTSKTIQQQASQPKNNRDLLDTNQSVVSNFKTNNNSSLIKTNHFTIGRNNESNTIGAIQPPNATNSSYHKQKQDESLGNFSTTFTQEMAPLGMNCKKPKDLNGKFEYQMDREKANIAAVRAFTCRSNTRVSSIYQHQSVGSPIKSCDIR